MLKPSGSLTFPDGLSHTNLLDPGGSNGNGVISNGGTSFSTSTFGVIHAAGQPKFRD